MVAVPGGLRGPVIAVLLAVTFTAWQHAGQPSAGTEPAEAPPPGATALPPAPPQPGLEARDADNVYIVRFQGYAMAEEHRERLAAQLQRRRWEWVSRNNPAARFPTDFGLIRADGTSLQEVQVALGGVAGVKDVHPDRMLTRSLKMEEPAGGAQPCGAAAPDAPALCPLKRRGRLQTRPTFDLDGNFIEDGLDDGAAAAALNSTAASRRRRRLQAGHSHNLAVLLKAEELWARGHRGGGVRVGVFDTGIKSGHPDVASIKERTNWTHEPTLDDGLGHGSFVAGVIAGRDPACPGLAPDVALHTFRVFTNDQVSYTSWFLDAFNYAIATEMDVVNLSIGGPDHLDRPFVEKVGEVTGAGIIMVSAIGNDGPLYGTLNNPADQNDVIGVGGIDWGGGIAGFSSRGMSTWELPLGYGRAKPDVMAFGKDVQGSRIGGGCRSLSGTSVASPVVAGAVCLLSSTLAGGRRSRLNPASMKQALVEGAVLLPHLNMFEQGQGKLDVLAAAKVLESYEPRASVVPAALDLSQCPYAWPFCRQPLYAGAMPLMFNATVLNGMGVVGRLEAAPAWAPADEGGRLLDVRFEWSPQLWPWSGNLAVYLRVKPAGAGFSGRASGAARFAVVSPPGPGETAPRRSEVVWNITAEVIPTPPRQKRLLWDQLHSIRYPPAYFPRDDLSVRHDILDWHGDHPHTNFHDMYDALRDAGYFLEVLASPATCFDAANYGALLIVDPEDEFYPEEIAKIASDVREGGLGLAVFADWYDVDAIAKMRFYDDNTRSWWEAATGGANVPALNDLLAPLGAAFAGGAFEMAVEAAPLGPTFRMGSGSAVAALPAGGYLYNATAPDKKGGGPGKTVPVAGIAAVGAGRLALYGDSNCLDSSHQQSNCHEMLMRMLGYLTRGDAKAAEPLLDPGARVEGPWGSTAAAGLPRRREGFNFTAASFVLQHPLKCWPNAPLEAQGLEYQGGEEGGAAAGGAGDAAAEVAGEEPPGGGLEVGAADAAGEGTEQEVEDRGSRDIAAQGEQQARAAADEAAATAAGGGGGGGAAVGGGDLQVSTIALGGGQAAGGGGGASGGAVLRPQSAGGWARRPTQAAQVFAVVGGVGMAVMYSRARRRRAGGGTPSSGRRSTLLPMFLRPGRRARQNTLVES